MALLLWLLAAALAAAGAPPADNARCLVCHLNFKEEQLARRHQQAGIGCERCHGESSAHTSDEDNVTPPDIVYATRAVNPLCLKCHPEERLRPKHQAAALKQQHCTACHGKHRLPVRSQRRGG